MGWAQGQVCCLLSQLGSRGFVVRLLGGSAGIVRPLSTKALFPRCVILQEASPSQACLQGSSLSGGQELNLEAEPWSHSMLLSLLLVRASQLERATQNLLSILTSYRLYHVCQRNFPACKQWKAATYSGNTGYGHINLCSELSSATYHGFVIPLLRYLTSPK